MLTASLFFGILFIKTLSGFKRKKITILNVKYNYYIFPQILEDWHHSKNHKMKEYLSKDPENRLEEAVGL